MSISSLGSHAVRQWRWTIPVLICATAVTVWLCYERPYHAGPHGQYSPGAITITWLLGFVVSFPTIAYYRLLIWFGEKFPRPARSAAVLVMLLLGSLVPPMIHNRMVEHEIAQRELPAKLPERFSTLGLVPSYQGDSRDSVHCDEECLRLLFGGIAKRLIISLDGDPTRVNRGVAPTRDRTTKDAIALRLEQRPVCPPIPSRHLPFGQRSDVPVAVIYPTPGGTDTEDRALALVASGTCLIAEWANSSDPEIYLGKGSFRGKYGPTLVPNSFGVVGAGFTYVDTRRGSTWHRVAQHVETGGYLKWTYPFALVPSDRSWIAARVDGRLDRPATSKRGQTWAWANLRLPDLPLLDRRQLFRGVNAALASDAPAADARHRLVGYALHSMAEDGDVDASLLARAVEDPRVAAGDLGALSRIGQRSHAIEIGNLLLDRIKREEDPREIERLAQIVSELPEGSWRALLPRMREIASDKERVGSAESALKLFAAGDLPDAQLLLNRFNADWPQPSLADASHPIPESARADVLAAGERLRSYLVGLCATADMTPLVRMRLLEASKESAPRPSDGSVVSTTLWGTMHGIGIDIERLATERGLSDGSREQIARIAQGQRKCGRRALSDRIASSTPADGDRARPANPYGDYRNSEWFKPYDILILFALVAAAGALGLGRLGKRERRVQNP